MNPAGKGNWNTGFGFIPKMSKPTREDFVIRGEETEYPPLYPIRNDTNGYIQGEVKESRKVNAVFPVSEMVNKLGPILERHVETRILNQLDGNRRFEETMRISAVDRFWRCYVECGEEEKAIMLRILLIYRAINNTPVLLIEDRDGFDDGNGILRVVISVLNMMMKDSEKMKEADLTFIEEQHAYLSSIIPAEWKDRWETIKWRTQAVTNFLERNQVTCKRWIRSVFDLVRETIQMIRSTF